MNFDKKKLSELLIIAKGDRSLNQYALKANVDSGYLSRLINMKRSSPPSPDILDRLANAAHNNVSYKDLMIAAGYIEVKNFPDHTDYIEYDETGEVTSIYTYPPDKKDLKDMFYDYLKTLDPDSVLLDIFENYESWTEEDKQSLKDYVQFLKSRKNKKTTADSDL
ncbi:hypothetical protein FQB35_10420 [Crassaminicella thermophila]|uniref:HTH cro/C1-type domain-containing protein n=1 Tax=Crassaminicella thermophila TaxID=2599308 RepID=A0A5C0SFN9_CRATE|nr:hypothetical protein [Crassaminicella thermophila]QEK12712.1 hypothetical protein FQB35_10420 [Crassaminicella thermophila]